MDGGGWTLPALVLGDSGIEKSGQRAPLRTFACTRPDLYLSTTADLPNFHQLFRLRRWISHAKLESISNQVLPLLVIMVMVDYRGLDDQSPVGCPVTIFGKLGVQLSPCHDPSTENTNNLTYPGYASGITNRWIRPRPPLGESSNT
jgi:hypothetical protein